MNTGITLQGAFNAGPGAAERLAPSVAMQQEYHPLFSEQLLRRETPCVLETANTR